ncbi:MAG: hypothetical protein HEEMFOPI_02006 [Holosporales bacterium]
MLPFTVIQRNSYYPFGMSFGEETDLEQGKQNFKYNDKELYKENSLNQYSYTSGFMYLAHDLHTPLVKQGKSIQSDEKSIFNNYLETNNITAKRKQMKVSENHSNATHNQGVLGSSPSGTTTPKLSNYISVIA